MKSPWFPGTGKTRNHYSFASKYCSHHFPEDYPIFDSYVEKMLRFYAKADQFASFKPAELRKLRKIRADYPGVSGIL